MGTASGIVYLYIHVCNEFMNGTVILKMWCGIDISVFAGWVGESDETQCGGCLLVLHTRESPSCGDTGNSEGEHHPLHYQDHSRETGKTVSWCLSGFINSPLFIDKGGI